jgi:hypothetical protein
MRKASFLGMLGIIRLDEEILMKMSPPVTDFISLMIDTLPELVEDQRKILDDEADCEFEDDSDDDEDSDDSETIDKMDKEEADKKINEI